MHNYSLKLLPKQFSNLWLTNLARRELNMQDQDQAQDEDDLNYIPQRLLRTDSLLYIQFVRLTFSMKQPLVHLPKTWNEFPIDEIKNARTKLQFKNLLKIHFLSQLSETAACRRLLCPFCHLTPSN